ncbi:MAG: glucoamylase family protein [Acidobacteriaceae bacterium]
MNRRTALRLFAGSAAIPAFGLPFESLGSPSGSLTTADEAFLDDMQRRGCLFFKEQASPQTGQVLDRAKWAGSDGTLDSRRMASIAATGFGLTALCIAEQRGYGPRAEIVEQVRRTMKFHAEQMPNQHGFFSHFTDRETAEPFRGSEISSIDTALLLCGVLTARAHFHNEPDIVHHASTIYERVDWPWMLNGGTMFSMGVRNGNFLESRWNHYCEHMMLYLLALGSPTHPVNPAAWDAWSRPTIEYQKFKYIGSSDPLFVHQYSHAWFDFRGKRDRYADYFENSIIATRAHEAFCIALGAPYSADYWGISASDSQHGYTAWGGPGGRGVAGKPGGMAAPQGFGRIDGSVVPYTTAGSLPFVPGDCMRVQRALKYHYGEKAWGRYGFCDAFHPEADWYDPDVLGIDLGIGVLMAENLRSGFVWKTFARNPEVGMAMERAGFHRN